MNRVVVWAVALSSFFALRSTANAAERPNVLFIMADDLNDWIGPLGGHPQVKTPNLDRLAKRGVTFANAHCASPLCNPSRAAIFSGRQPFETGVLSNDGDDVRKMHPKLVLIPQHFKAAGYRTFGTGKLLHQSGAGLFDEHFLPEQRWSPFTKEQTDYTPDELPSKGSDAPRHVTTLKDQTIVLPINRMPSDRAPTTKSGESFDWGGFDVADSEMGDGQITDWAVERLKSEKSAPFFLGVGFYRPHIPLFVPQKYLAMYDGVKLELPAVLESDLDDLSAAGRKWALEADTAGLHATVVKHGQWEAAVRAYLACVTFVDAQVGKLLDAVDAGPHADNTLIVFMSDHGWHLGEKQHWGKWTGWRRATRVPLIVALPRNSSNAPRGAACDEPVSLIDVYPSLVDVCSLPPRDGLSGRSFGPLLDDPQTSTGRAIVTTFGSDKNYSVTEKRRHYLRYADGTEELYDLAADPHEWRNLAADPQYAAAMAELRKALPRGE